MAFDPTIFADGSPNPVSALELITLVSACYWNDVGSINLELAQLGGGVILGFHYEPITWPPSWTVVRSGDTIVICFAGTDTIPHIFGDTTGAYGTPYRASAVQAHTFFLSSWNTLKPTIMALLPNDVNACDIIFTGHSMGGAEMYLAALDLAQARIGKSTAVLTFSPAKTLTAGFVGPFPGVANFLAPLNDSIPFLPPFNGVSAVIGPAADWIFGIPIGWTHYEQGWTYNDNAGFTAQDRNFWNGWPSPSTVAATATTHPTAFQGTIIANICAGLGLDAAHEAIRKILLSIFLKPPPPSIFFPPNPAAFVDLLFQNNDVFFQTVPPALTTINAGTVNTLAGSATQSGALAAAPIFSTFFTGGATMAYAGAAKITFFYTDLLGGFSETWYCANGPTAVTPANLVAYLETRLAASGMQTTWLYCRVSLVASPRVVSVFYPADLPALTTVTGTAGLPRSKLTLVNSDISNTSLLIRRTNVAIYSFWFMRGVPDIVVEAGGVYTPTGAWNYPNILNALFLLTQALGWGFVGRTPASQGVLPLASIAINANTGTATFTVGGAVGFPMASPLNPALTPYQYRLAVRLRRLSNPRQANGVYTVTVISQTQCVTLDQFPYSGFATTGVEQLVYNVPQVIVPTKFSVEKCTSRKAGRPFGLRAGRARTRLAR